ncbi:hypothetical protein OPIT5_30080 [Opitutaceae bacterium TAV5]|nr:hypothetical protein OPIT5_30080 [Opitutaceae bacterium TAV5]
MRLTGRVNSRERTVILRAGMMMSWAGAELT